MLEKDREGGGRNWEKATERNKQPVDLLLLLFHNEKDTEEWKEMI